MKILYLMHVDWNWIKQRPHFIAEELAKHFDIIILYNCSYRRNRLIKTESNVNIEKYPLHHIPKSSKIRVLKQIEKYFQKRKIKKIIKLESISHIYLPYPTFVSLLPKDFNGKIIYDCMDLYSGFSEDKELNNYIIEKEKQLVSRADYIFASSSNLCDFLRNTYLQENLKKEIFIIRNAFNNSIIENTTTTDEKKKSLIICYFGTISNWFDFNLIIKSLKDLDFITYKIIGPSEITLPKHPRIHYTGPVKHNELYKETSDVDIFIMPFILNDVIKGVDPVKLYEYINFNKNIICVRYKEVERFSPFVHFYNNYSEYKEILLNLRGNNTLKYSLQERIKFLSENTWDERGKYIKQIIDKDV